MSGLICAPYFNAEVRPQGIRKHINGKLCQLIQTGHSLGKCGNLKDDASKHNANPGLKEKPGSL